MHKGYSDLRGVEQFVVDHTLLDDYLIDNLIIEKNIYSRDCV